MENGSETKRGRPSSYTPELADQVCALICEGYSLRSIAKMDGMPSVVTVFAWIRKHEEFAKQYARAKEDQQDAFAEEIQDIADDATNDFMEIEVGKGKTQVVFDKEHVQRSKLRIETRQWLMGKLRPKKYGTQSVLQTQQLDKEGNPTDPPTGNTDAIMAAALNAAQKVKDEQSNAAADDKPA